MGIPGILPVPVCKHLYALLITHGNRNRVLESTTEGESCPVLNGLHELAIAIHLSQ
jgi:hypothetical protein